MRNSVRTHPGIEPNFDDMFKTPRRKRKPARTGFFARFGARNAADLLAGAIALAAIIVVLVNALGLQKSPHLARASTQAVQKPVPLSAPVVAPLPQPRPDPASGRSRADLVRDVQQELASRGYYDGAVDGAPGPRINQAIRDFESIQRLRVTGEASETLLGQIRKAGPKSDVTGSIGPAKPSAGNPRILSVQRQLARFGYGPLRMNGAADKETREAVARFERDRDLPQTGEITDRLVRELAAYSGGAPD